MGAPLYEPLLVKLIQHPHEGDRLDAQPSRDLSLADTFIPCDVEHDRGLLTGDQKAHLPCSALEPSLDQSRNVVNEKAEGATDLGMGRGALEGSLRWILQSLGVFHGMRAFIQRHDGPPRELLSECPRALPVRATAGTGGRATGRSVQGRGK